MENKVWSNEEIKEMLYFNLRAVGRAVMAIFKLSDSRWKKIQWNQS